MRSKLVLILAVMLALGLYDQFTGVLGANWLLLWLAMVPVALLWLYYALLMPRAAIHVKPSHLRLQGPLYGRKISFKRIRSISPDKLEQHFAYQELTFGERPVLKPLHGRTCLFVELVSFPKAFNWRRLWFPRTLFGTRKLGLICYVDDWMALSRELESVRARHLALTSASGHRQKMTLAGRILAEDIDFT